MTSFVALYRGRTIHDAQVIAVSIDPHLVKQVATVMESAVATTGDKILDSLGSGRRRALQRVARRRKSTAGRPTHQARPASAASPNPAHQGGEISHDADSGS